MSKKAHTKGPWLIREGFDPDDWEIYPMRDGPPDVGEWTELAVVPGHWGDDEELEANARLIAAAPDLLEALERLLAAAEKTTFSDQFPQECENARAALSKATGGE